MRSVKFWALVLVGIVLILGEGNPSGELILATTTSVYDSGLLDELNRAFEAKFDVRVKVLAVGSGTALRHGRDGDVDVVLVHDPEGEEEFLRGGWGVNRRHVMKNDYLIIGPADDPAGIAGLGCVEAFRKIAAKEVLFISRGDLSGTHKRELEIWKRAGITPSGKWYIEVGAGMGTAIIQADLMGAYTLSDRGTFIALKDKISLKALSEDPSDPLLSNLYSIMAVNPKRHPHVNYKMAKAYIEFLTSKGQEIIENYRKGGKQLFYSVR
jgi:tungstate transport system substrate-binding protein